MAPTTGTAAPAAPDLGQRLAADLDEAYPVLVRAHAGAVYSAALRLSGSAADAEDIAQETFVRAYRALRRYDGPRRRALRVRPWLLTITVNQWRNARRDAARRPVEAAGPGGRSAHGAAPRPDPPAPAPGPEDRAVSAETGRVLAALLLEVPAHHRLPVVLHHVVGMTYPEVAAALGCPVGTAKANAARGMERLRALAATTEEEP
ncbi:MAG TPA: sigma-70 family RNA polymerase sigma factor [Acidimicrobiales bacterium]|nr:sigma-70 family RNA polymerase sigma factor [Acidimicrobiales bacterium]